MARYYPGVNEALAKVDGMDEQQCICLLEDLYGTDNLKYGATLEQVREEARRQIREDFRDRSRPEEDAWIEAMAKAARST